jgi:hypothetical protein
MSYCKEFFEWTNTEGDYNFSIKEISSGMLPGNNRPNSCNGIGFNAMYKDLDGTLMLNVDGELRKFIEIKTEFLNNHQSSQRL